MDVSLVRGWLPIVVQVIALAVVLAAVGWRSRTWRSRWVPVAAAVGVAFAAVAYWFVTDQDLADDPAPVLLWPWVAMTGLAVVVAVLGWRGSRWWRRVTSLAAIPLCTVCVALLVDGWTGYLPTLDAALGRATGAALPSQTDEAGVADMRRRHVHPTEGTLVSVRIGADASGFRHRDELVYLPPAWFAGDAPPELPAVIMAGGEFGHPIDWPTTGQARQTADAFAAAHGGNAPVLVFVDTSGEFSNDTECVNGIRGNAADHLTKDVVPFVVSHFGTSSDAARWGFVGWSAGGTCALMTTVMHPELFSAFVDVDGELGPTAGSRQQTIARLFGGDATAFTAFDPATVMEAHGQYTGPAGWFAVSTPGPTVYYPAGGNPPDQRPADIAPEDHLAVASYLCPLASSHGIPCAVVPTAGNHDFGGAARAFAAALPWLAGRLGTPATPVVPLPGAAPAS
ncbi:alpha/beta hydrolase-fold protein [Mycolicibacterium sp. 050158]|nr:alpha/beta hydrolase-fold protein [Mycolicibacterium sp. 050158]MDX1891923.1 alpha/beta hydrolase-fold protein [Mycolicibacterium sp. 050158]